MPVVDEFVRAQPLSPPDHSTPAVGEAVRRTPVVALRRWMAGLQRTFANAFGRSAVDWTAWRGE